MKKIIIFTEEDIKTTIIDGEVVLVVNDSEQIRFTKEALKTLFEDSTAYGVFQNMPDNTPIHQILTDDQISNFNPNERKKYLLNQTFSRLNDLVDDGYGVQIHSNIADASKLNTKSLDLETITIKVKN